MKLLLNAAPVEVSGRCDYPALDFIREEQGLLGTKEGCREGDCGACSVIVGRRIRANDAGSYQFGQASFDYRAMPSCLLTLGELEGRQLITIEGLVQAAGQSRNASADPQGAGKPALTPVMEALSEANGSQCGFCSPGFVISLTAYLFNGDPQRAGCLSLEGAVKALDGNLCRCTGYGAIKRAAERLVREFSDLPTQPEARLAQLVSRGVLPASCLDFIKGKFELEEAQKIKHEIDDAGSPASASPTLVLGGGSDYFVRNPDPEDRPRRLVVLGRNPRFTRIESNAEELIFGAAVSWREFFASARLRRHAPGIESCEELLASPLVRERATIGGNIANASPVGDVTSMLLALGARLRLAVLDSLTENQHSACSEACRELPLESFFIGYKKLALEAGEVIESVILPLDRSPLAFSFEKASKREHLDIAAVNTAASFMADSSGFILQARVSAGGVAATPLLLRKTSDFFTGRKMDAQTAREAARIAVSEVSPIGDVRGSADYRSRLLGRLIVAHCIKLFPDSGCEEALS